MRKVLGMATVTVVIKEWEEGGYTHIDVENRPNGGLPPTTEQRVFNNEGVDIAHALFGKVRSQTRWATKAELDEVNGFLADGLETGEKEEGGAKPSYVHIATEHLEHGVTTHQVWGFAQFNEQRYQTRHILVIKGEETAKVTLVYDYLGPRAADES